MANTIRVGMVGYGEMGRRQALAWRALALAADEDSVPVRLVSVAAPLKEAVAAREGAGFEVTTGDPEEVIGHPEVDIIHVCAPADERAPALRSAMASGKHTLCSAPLAGDIRDSEEIAALAGRIPGKRQMVSEWRWLPVVLRAQALIQEGRIGEPQAFRLSCRRSLAEGMAAGTDERVAASVLDGLLPQALDVARALNGNVGEVSAVVESMLDPQANVVSPTHEMVAALLRFANGSVGILEASHCLHNPEDSCRVEVSGSSGSVSFDLARPGALTVSGASCLEIQVSGDSPLPGGRLGGDVACLRAFLRSVREDDPTAPSFRDGLMVQRTIAAIVASAEEGSWKPVDLGR